MLIPYGKYARCFDGNQKEESRGGGSLEYIRTSDVQDSRETQDGNGFSSETLIFMIPKAYEYKVKTILIHVLNDPKHTLRWNYLGELLCGSKENKGSNVEDVLKECGYKRPVGVAKLYRTMRGINFQRSLIGNADTLKLNLGDHMGLLPSIPQYITKKMKMSRK